MDWEGNDRADRAAKAEATRRAPSKEIVSSRLTSLDKAKTIMRIISAVQTTHLSTSRLKNKDGIAIKKRKRKKRAAKTTEYELRPCMRTKEGHCWIKCGATLLTRRAATSSGWPQGR